MGRCHGTTQSGTRCRRSVREGVRFCTTHADQSSASDGSDVRDDAVQRSNPLDAVIALAVAGVVLGAVLTFRRFFRFP
jgi:hypothetical protein